ncbi:MAG: glycosyl transferase [Cereibacter sphaeroides]|uniref:Glycosyl transferase n=1 Tax=Cereibacter sphaeroides TaxID=1063 RepID=A0A2W5SGG5_CERSP|nr:MAG: glycosyl transferase [Cereibacter sphaeroides]
MPARRLAALFRRYAAAHLTLTMPGEPFYDDNGQRVGQLDRLVLRGGRIVAEGWTAARAVALSLGTARVEQSPALERRDVVGSYPELAGRFPGFALDLPLAEGPAIFSLGYPDRRLIYRVALPDPRRIARARLKLAPAFLRDLARAAPALLRWLATRDTDCRGRVKRALRLAEPAGPTSLQRLLFLEDSMAELTASARAKEAIRLTPPALSRHPITIVLPVYNAFDLLPEVLSRVVEHTDLPWHMILIEDASTDPGVRPWLRDWAARTNASHPGRITLVENESNRGFIVSVNLGLKLALQRGHDVVLLNSDAFVPKAWASRLMRPFLMHDNVATVTPMSNDAEILTVPVICRRTELKSGEAEGIDHIASKFHPDAGLIDAPTGVGFCMAISHDWLRRLPALDTAFGRGYGEEVDWCRRARALGGRHLALPNLFVEHRGGTSFGSAEKARLIAANNALVSQRHPGFDAEVQGFIAADPLVTPRLALAIALAAARVRGRMPVYLGHSLGGGAEDYLTQRIAKDLGAEGAGAAMVLRVGGRWTWQVELHLPQGMTRGGTDDFAFVERLLAPVVARDIIYSCGVGHPDPGTLPDTLLRLRREGDRIEVLFHDYLPISPSYTLTDVDGRHRGLPDPQDCDPAHRPRNGLSLHQWQRQWGRLLGACDAVTVFSADSQRLVLGAYPQTARRIRTRPHQPLAKVPRCLPPSGRRPVIGILGNIGAQKGAAVVADLSKRLAMSDRIGLALIGNIDPAFAIDPKAICHGSYRREDIPALVARYGIDRWLIPSIWPETWSYTTHEALATGLPVWCFDLGAQGEAVRAARHMTGQGGTLPLKDGYPDIEALLAAIAAVPTLERVSA